VIPGEREEWVAEPIQPTQTPDLVVLFEMQVQPEVEELVEARTGNALALSANVGETPAHPLITVGRWRVISDGRREEEDGPGRAPRSRTWG
jgi:hypothetical protein